MIEFTKIQKKLNDWIHITRTDSNWTITEMNEKYNEVSGYKRSDLIGKNYFNVQSIQQSDVRRKLVEDGLKTKKSWQGELESYTKHKKAYWESVMIIPFFDGNGNLCQYLIAGVELSNAFAKEQGEPTDSFQKMIKHLENTIFKYILTEDDRLVFTLSEGRIAERIGFVTEVVQNREVEDFFPDDIWPIMKKNFKEAALGRSTNFEMHLFGTDFLVYLSPITEDDEVIEVVGTALDITKRKEHEKMINYMAYHDSLTGLLNRVAFHEVLAKTVEEGESKNKSFAVLFLDLDRFKNINDTLGHRIGDRLLTAVAQRLQESVKESDTVARLGGDEYAIILSDLERDEAEEVVQYLIEQFSKPFELENHELYTMASIGVSLFPQDGQDGEILLAHADLAMYHAKEENANKYSFFTTKLKTEIEDRELLERELENALEHGEFVLYYQPQINMQTKKVFGVEALIRWQHPKKGLVFPGEFIAIAEETGLIVPIGEWVLHEAAKQNTIWQEAGYDPIVISVNVSPQQFLKRDFLDTVKQTLKDTGLKPQYLELEITESATIDVRTTQRLLDAFQSLGVQVSIDDFGTGYSSLNYLSQLSINKLKIDQSFIRGMDKKNQAIVKTIISLAKNLDMDVIAEGVEMEEHVEFLKEQHCHQAQGYLFSKPLPEEKVRDYF